MRLPTPPMRYDAEFERERNRQIEDADAENVKHAGKRVYAASNVTVDRTFDANAAAGAADLAALKVIVEELADILGTLIADLREKKIVG
jgi:hypothetical protein